MRNFINRNNFPWSPGRSCRKKTGDPNLIRTKIASLPGTFRLMGGSPKIYIKTAESGNKRAHGFCPECGTPIYSTAPEPNPSTYGLRVGGIDQRGRPIGSCQAVPGKVGAVRRCPGRWICAVWSGRSDSETAAADCIRARPPQHRPTKGP